MGEQSYHNHITDSTEHSTVTGLVGWTDTVGGVVYNSHTWCSLTLKAKQSGHTAGYVVFMQHATYMYKRIYKGTESAHDIHPIKII